MNQSPMFKHAIESFEHGLEHYLDGSDKSRKFAFLHIDQAIELFLKEKVVQIGRSIYKSDGTTLGIHETFNSLKAISIPEQPRLEELHDLRNTIQHKGLTPDIGSTHFYMEIAYNFVKRFLGDELSTVPTDILSKKHIALMEGQPLDGIDQVIEALERAKQAEDASGKIIMGYTALIQAVQLLGDPSLGRVGVRRTLREAARYNGVDREKLDPYLHVVLSTRNQVTQSNYQPTDLDALNYLEAVSTIIKMIGIAK